MDHELFTKTNRFIFREKYAIRFNILQMLSMLLLYHSSFWIVILCPLINCFFAVYFAGYIPGYPNMYDAYYQATRKGCQSTLKLVSDNKIYFVILSDKKLE